MAITGVKEYSSYYASVTATQKTYNRAAIDPNKKYQSDTEFANDLFALEKKLQVQYSNMTSDYNLTTVEDLKKEISSLFPEYTFTTSKPKDVTRGKNLLYIDETNLNKMLKDPSYKSQVYALMGRELAGNNGFHVYGSAWKLTGTTFTLSEGNSREGGIPYEGMGLSVRLDDSYTFKGTNNKISIFSMAEKVQTAKTCSKKEAIKKDEKPDKKDTTFQSQTEEMWEKERMKYADYVERREQEQLENKEQMNKLNKEAIAKKYQENVI